MSLKLGSTGIGSLYLGSTKIAEAYLGSTKVYGSAAGNYTLLLKFSDGVTPTFTKGDATQISSSPTIWDWSYSDTNWGGSFMDTATRAALLEVISGNTQGVTSMNNWFSGCSSLTSIPLLDTSSVTSMSSMFYGCSSLTSVPLFDTSSVTSMYGVFYGCSSLTSVPLFNTANVTRMDEMFLGCSSLTSVPSFNKANVTNMTNMFRDCSSLTSVPLFNTSNVTNMDYMLGGCTHIAQSAYDLYTTAYSTASFNHAGAFADCGSLSGTSRLSDIYVTWGGTKNGTTVSTTVKSAKQLWTISTGSAPWGLDKPLYLHGPNPFSTTSPTVSKSSITWTGTAQTGSFLVYPAVIQFNSGYSGALSFIRMSSVYLLSYPSSSNTPSQIKLEITAARYPITAGSYSVNKTLYFAYVAYVSLSNYGLQQCTNFNNTPTLYWTY